MKLGHACAMVLGLTACAHVGAPRQATHASVEGPSAVAPPEDRPAPEPPPEPEPALKGVRATLDVWGGDGEGLPAIWSLIVRVVIENHGRVSLTVRSARWEAAGLGLEAETDTEHVVASGGRVVLDARTRIPLATLRAVRAREAASVRWTVRWSRGDEEDRSTVSVDARLGVE